MLFGTDRGMSLRFPVKIVIDFKGGFHWTQIPKSPSNWIPAGRAPMVQYPCKSS